MAPPRGARAAARICMLGNRFVLVCGGLRLRRGIRDGGQRGDWDQPPENCAARLRALALAPQLHAVTSNHVGLGGSCAHSCASLPGTAAAGVPVAAAAAGARTLQAGRPCTQPPNQRCASSASRA